MTARKKKTTTRKRTPTKKKTSSRSKSNGTASAAPNYQTVSLTEDQQMALRDLDQQMANQKIQLANQAMRAADLRSQLRALKEDMETRTKAIDDMGKQFVSVVKMMANSHGINVEEQVENPWRLKLDSMEFTNEPVSPSALTTLTGAN